MGQKTHPVGLRLGIVKTWDSRWFAKKNFAELLKEDIFLKRYLKHRLFQAGISKIVVERKASKVTITIKTARWITIREIPACDRRFFRYLRMKMSSSRSFG